MNRRTFTKILIAAGAVLGLGAGPRKHGRVNVNEHGGHWRARVNGREVSRECYEADDRAGYALCFKRNANGCFYIQHAPGCSGGNVRSLETSHDDCADLAKERLVGNVRIEKT